MSRARILVADDKENMLKLFRKILPEDIDVVTAEDGTHALAIVAAGDIDVVVTDIKMPAPDGLEVLEIVKRSWPDVEVILMTAYGSVPTAVDAIKRGAYDYITKPFEPEEVLVVVERAIERRRLRVQTRDLRSALDGASRFETLVGRSPAMIRLFDLMRRAAQTDATALVTGESGTGKELVVRALHAASTRRERRFVAINCGAIPENLMEAELFGFVKGAFTGASSAKTGLFEEANGGSLLLNEIGELPLGLQVKLTRVLQERAVRRLGATDEHRVDVRVFAATHVDLKAAVAEGRFREDLYYRLNILQVSVPPLRERREDIPMLATTFIVREGGARFDGFTHEALAALLRYDWPGNVRELENAVARAVAVSDGPRIDLVSLPDEVAAAAAWSGRSEFSASLTYREVVELARDRASREYLVALMHEFEGSVTRAAERAGVERESLHRLMRRFGVRSEDYKR